MSPERLDGQDYNASSDIWSVGVMVMELYEQRYPFRQASSTHVDLSMEFQSIDIEGYMTDNGYPTLMAEFLSLTLQINPLSRPEASVLLESNWFKHMGIYDLDYATETLQTWLRQHTDCFDNRGGDTLDNMSPELAEFKSRHGSYKELSDQKNSE